MTGAQLGKLRDAIVRTFKPTDFEMFLQIELDKVAYLYSNNGNGFQYQVWQLINDANMQAWAEPLLLSLVRTRPAEKSFQELAFETKVSQQVYSGAPGGGLTYQGFEALVNGDPLLDPAVFIERLLRNSEYVCRIEIQLDSGKEAYGTGCLVGPDLLLSNFHVFEPLIREPASVRDIKCLFDYRVAADGTTIDSGVEIGLAENPLIACSPYSSQDVSGNADIDAWPDSQLDYALVRLAKPVGTFPRASREQISSHPTTRGWIDTKNLLPIAKSGRNLIIIQHPSSQPQKVALGFDKVQSLSANGSRIRYNINTMKGSSGSPCFDAQFNWIALHNLGDPSWMPVYNQGIASSMIISDILSKGVVLP